MLLPPSGITYLKLSCPGTSPSVFSPSVHVDEACNLDVVIEILPKWEDVLEIGS